MPLIRGDALRLPLAPNSVDLVCTSPPYFSLRSYQDDGAHYANQIGSEPGPVEFLEALWAVTAELVRVLKPGGSIWVNLGDKYAGSGGHNNAGIMPPRLFDRPPNTSGGEMRKASAGEPRNQALARRRNAPDRYNQASAGVPDKSLMLLPEAYRLGCNGMLHALGGPPPPGGQALHARAVVVWSKPNGLPESVQDRVRRSHEDWVHLTKLPRYYAAVDEIREASMTGDRVMFQSSRGKSRGMPSRGPSDSDTRILVNNPLGKLPGSVWTVPTEPLTTPQYMAVTGPRDMNPTFLPAELAVRQWARAHGLEPDGHPANRWPRQHPAIVAAPDHFAAFPTEWPRRLILGWSPSGVCRACGEGRRPVVEKDEPQRHEWAQQQQRERAKTIDGGVGKVNLGVPAADRNTRITGEACACPTPDAPTRPAVVLDPFLGTGTTVAVARSLGRLGVGLDLSADYLRLARWRVDNGSAKATQRTHAANQGQLL